MFQIFPWREDLFSLGITSTITYVYKQTNWNQRLEYYCDFTEKLKGVEISLVSRIKGEFACKISDLSPAISLSQTYASILIILGLLLFLFKIISLLCYFDLSQSFHLPTYCIQRWLGQSVKRCDGTLRHQPWMTLSEVLLARGLFWMVTGGQKKFIISASPREAAVCHGCFY